MTVHHYDIAHFTESLIAWLVGFIWLSNPGGLLAGIAFVAGKEGSDLHDKWRWGKPMRGDLRDTMIHILGFLIPAVITYVT